MNKIKSTNPIRKGQKKKRWEEISGNIFTFWWRKILFNANFLRGYGANDEIKKMGILFYNLFMENN